MPDRFSYTYMYPHVYTSMQKTKYINDNGTIEFIGKFAKRGQRIQIEIPKKLIDKLPEDKGEQMIISVFWKPAIS